MVLLGIVWPQKGSCNTCTWSLNRRKLKMTSSLEAYLCHLNPKNATGMQWVHEWMCVRLGGKTFLYTYIISLDLTQVWINIKSYVNHTPVNWHLHEYFALFAFLHEEIVSYKEVLAAICECSPFSARHQMAPLLQDTANWKAQKSFIILGTFILYIALVKKKKNIYSTIKLIFMRVNIITLFEILARLFNIYIRQQLPVEALTCSSRSTQ